ncbi:MAG: hypothetical protein ABIQ60_15580 [Burkholderiaceae bacterium]
MFDWKLIPNWRAVLKHAWSYKLAILASALTAVDLSMQAFASTSPSPWILVLATLSSLAASGARFINQPKVNDVPTPPEEYYGADR